MTTDELCSELASARSLSAEAEMFLGYVRGHGATRHFAQGHVEYLIGELDRSAKKLHTSLPPQGEEPVAQRLGTLVDALNTELHEVRGSIDQDAVLWTAQEDVRQIRLAIDQANSCL